ncbi:MAG: hypothetical protein ACW98U_03180 [Candidatus Thorarchaeota archaeon]|jgi:hypothetical protein
MRDIRESSWVDYLQPLGREPTEDEIFAARGIMQVLLRRVCNRLQGIEYEIMLTNSVLSVSVKLRTSMVPEIHEEMSIVFVPFPPGLIEKLTEDNIVPTMKIIENKQRIVPFVLDSITARKIGEVRLNYHYFDASHYQGSNDLGTARVLVEYAAQEQWPDIFDEVTIDRNNDSLLVHLNVLDPQPFKNEVQMVGTGKAFYVIKSIKRGVNDPKKRLTITYTELTQTQQSISELIEKDKDRFYV